MNLSSRLVKHLAVAATAAAGVVGTTNAATVYSGIINLNIPATTNGLYMNVVNGQINEPGNGAGSSVPGWDINPWSSTAFGLFSATGSAALALMSSTATFAVASSVEFPRLFRARGSLRWP